MARQYRYQYKCPVCQRPYAKKTLWVQHIATHSQAKKVSQPT
jgi:hypothetical protein